MLSSPACWFWLKPSSGPTCSAAASAAEFPSPWSMPASPTAPGRATGACAFSGAHSSHALAACWPKAQTDAERLLAIGCRPESVTVAGNLKFDVRAAQEADATRILKSICRRAASDRGRQHARRRGVRTSRSVAAVARSRSATRHGARPSPSRAIHRRRSPARKIRNSVAQALRLE